MRTMKTKVMLAALIAAFAITMFSSCTGGDCDEVQPTEQSTNN